MVQVNWLGRNDRRAADIHGRARPYWHGVEKNSKLELGRARFKAGWGSGVRWLNGESRDMMNRAMVTQPCRIKRAGSAGRGGREGEAGLARLILALAASGWPDPRHRLRTSYATTQLLTQKCGDVINTQQAGRSEWNETRDLLGFNTEPADSENPTTCQSI